MRWILVIVPLLAAVCASSASAAPAPKVVEATCNGVPIGGATAGLVDAHELIWFEVRAANQGSMFKGHGGVAISVPGFATVEDWGTESLSDVNVVTAGEPVPGSPDGAEAEHVMVYAERWKWMPGDDGALAVAVEAPVSGFVEFRVRVSFMDYDWDAVGLDPPWGSTGVTDQQGYAVYVYHVDVIPPPLPDLVVAQLAVDGEEPAAGEPVKLVATLANQGDAWAGPGGILVEYLLDGEVCDTDVVSSGLGVGESVVETSLACVPPTPGDHVFAVRVDGNGTVAESNEANNETAILVPVVEGGPFCAKECVDQQVFTDEFEASFPGLVSSNGLWRKSTQPWMCQFETEQVVQDDGMLRLTVPEGGLSCGEVMSHSGDFYYGSYRASIKVSDVAGVCGAFFMYNSDVQEIDVEILSQEDDLLHRVHFITQPSGFLPCGSGPHKCHDLPDKPSDEFHEYGFDWHPDRVEFYVDGVKVAQTTENVPMHPGHLVLSNWAGNPGWTGPLPKDTATMEVAYVTYEPFDYCAVCPGCGNGLVTDGEACDGKYVDGMQCQDVGFAQGQMACTDGCQLDTSDCSGVNPCTDDSEETPCAGECGNGLVELDEECDGDPPMAGGCAKLGWDGGELACTDECTLDDSGCFEEQGCGNGVLDPGEACDGNDLGGKTCADLGFADEGMLACTLECELQTAACKTANPCGNGVVDQGEECDRQALGGKTCASLGFAGGTLSCRPDCDFDTVQCFGHPVEPPGERDPVLGTPQLEGVTGQVADDGPLEKRQPPLTQGPSTAPAKIGCASSPRDRSAAGTAPILVLLLVLLVSVRAGRRHPFP